MVVEFPRNTCRKFTLEALGSARATSGHRCRRMGEAMQASDPLSLACSNRQCHETVPVSSPIFDDREAVSVTGGMAQRV